jgi:hypothetical protein
MHRLKRGSGVMDVLANATVRIQQMWQESDQVAFSRNELQGQCLPLISTLDIRNLPWELRPWRRGDPPVEENAITCVKKSTTRSVLTFTLPTADANQSVRLFVKRCKPRVNLKTLFSWCRKSKCAREWDLGWELRRRGIPTAFPLGWADQRVHGLLRESYLVTLGLENTCSFYDLYCKLGDQDARMFWMGNLGHFIRQAHEKGFAHDDLSSEHVLVEQYPEAPADVKGPQFYFIDLDQSRLYPGAVTPYRRAHNFFQIFRSLPPELLGQAEREAFYSGYSSGIWKPEHIAAFEQSIRLITFQKKIARLFRLKTYLGR